MARDPLIVLAEDDADDRQLAAEALGEAGLPGSLHCVGDGEELLAYLRARDPAVPAVVLLDLNMPRKDGREALADLKRDPALRRIPVVVFTTSRDEDDVRAAYDLGASSFITKPVTFAGLVDVLRDVGAYWFGRVTLPAT